MHFERARTQRWRGLPTMLGNTALGASSPAKPACQLVRRETCAVIVVAELNGRCTFIIPLPLSITIGSSSCWLAGVIVTLDQFRQIRHSERYVPSVGSYRTQATRPTRPLPSAPPPSAPAACTSDATARRSSRCAATACTPDPRCGSWSGAGAPVGWRGASQTGCLANAL